VPHRYVCPATTNDIEAVGKHQPVVAMPFSNWAQIGFPAVQDAIRKLSGWGVTVLVGDEIYKQHEPGTGEHYIQLFPWHLAWQALLSHPWLTARPRHRGRPARRQTITKMHKYYVKPVTKAL
jgi:hypothetical protein